MSWLWIRALKRDLNAHFALDLTFVVLIAGFAGARLLHVVYEEPSFYAENPVAALFFWDGGFVYLGGAVTGILASWIFCAFRQESFWQWADIIAPVAALAYGFGRVGCFLRGCCFGRACDLPWAVSFPSHLEMSIPIVPRHPTQLYALLFEVLIVAFLLWREKRPHFTGQIFLLWLMSHAVARSIVEVFRDDPRGFAPLGLSLATWMSVMIFLSASYFYQIRQQQK